MGLLFGLIGAREEAAAEASGEVTGPGEARPTVEDDREAALEVVDAVAAVAAVAVDMGAVEAGPGKQGFRRIRR